MKDEIKVGSRVRCVELTCGDVGRGLNVGAMGVVVDGLDFPLITVKFDGLNAKKNHDKDGCVTDEGAIVCCPSQLELVELPTEYHGFKVGERVRVNFHGDAFDAVVIHPDEWRNSKGCTYDMKMFVLVRRDNGYTNGFYPSLISRIEQPYKVGDTGKTVGGWRYKVNGPIIGEQIRVTHYRAGNDGPTNRYHHIDGGACNIGGPRWSLTRKPVGPNSHDPKTMPCKAKRDAFKIGDRVKIISKEWEGHERDNPYGLTGVITARGATSDEGTRYEYQVNVPARENTVLANSYELELAPAEPSAWEVALDGGDEFVIDTDGINRNDRYLVRPGLRREQLTMVARDNGETFEDWLSISEARRFLGDGAWKFVGLAEPKPEAPQVGAELAAAILKYREAKAAHEAAAAAHEAARVAYEQAGDKFIQAGNNRANASRELTELAGK
ncbi:hypothetical protein [Bradyrhizobium sp. 613_E4_N2_2]|uniref:hypothetical protein n=1 Tax=Bradyrhizobium sp. 613_E4_N2_2 TaxID=3240371 RepID=UPI003F8B34FC